jgi:hypothetical protein
MGVLPVVILMGAYRCSMPVQSTMHMDAYQNAFYTFFFFSKAIQHELVCLRLRLRLRFAAVTLYCMHDA